MSQPQRLTAVVFGANGDIVSASVPEEDKAFARIGKHMLGATKIINSDEDEFVSSEYYGEGCALNLVMGIMGGEWLGHRRAAKGNKPLILGGGAVA